MRSTNPGGARPSEGASVNGGGIPAELTLDASRIDEIRARVRRGVAWAAPRALAGDVEDLEQDVMIRVFRRLARGGSVNARYIQQTIHSVIVDEIRRRRVRQAELLAESENAVDPVAPASLSPEARARDGQVTAAIRGCVEALPEPRRSAVQLHLLGHTVPEVAELLRVGRKSAENLVYRAMKALRGCLSARGFAPGS